MNPVYLLKRLFLPFAGFVLLLSFASCEKDPNVVGLSVTPPQDQIYGERMDTATIVAYSVLEDSIKTNYTSLNLLGSTFDPVFGRTDASFYTQYLLSSVNVDFGPNPVVDSLILYLGYNGYYGDTTTPLTLRVYEMDESIYLDSAYYSNSTTRTKGTELAHMTFRPKPTDSVMVDTVKVGPLLKINMSKISKDFANRIINAPKEVLASNSEFIKYIKGLYVKVDPVSYKGSILYFNLMGSLSALNLYYHNDSVDSLRFPLVVNEYTARYNHFGHNHYLLADPNFRKQLIYKDTTLGNQVLYLQATGGVRVKMWFPYLKNWSKDKKIAINEAKLILPNRETDGEYEAPAKLVLLANTEDGALSQLKDELEGSTYFGGSYLKASHEYQFRVSRYVQSLVNNSTTDYGLSLLVSGSAVRGNRLMLNGAKSQERPVKLQIKYSYSN